MKNFLIFLIMIGILIGLLAGIFSDSTTSNKNEINSDEDTQKNKEINELNLAIPAIDTLNPLKTKNIYVSDILSLIYEPLVIIDEYEQVSECLATDWGKKDSVTWFIKVRENALWHDGEKFISKDVKSTIEYIGNNQDSLFYANISNVKSIDIVDDTTLVITLYEPDPYIMQKLTFPIIPSKYIQEDLGHFDVKNIGTGPYFYVSENDISIILEQNKDWWKKKDILLNRIYVKKYSSFGEIIKGFKSSEVDMIVTSMHNWKEKVGFIGINAYKYENDKYDVIIPNTKRQVLDDANIRKAILYSINRENIVNTVYDDNASIKDIPIKSSSKYASGHLDYSIELAQELFTSAGCVKKNNLLYKNNKKISFTLLVIKDDEEKVLVAEKIKNDLKDVGIAITVKKLEKEEFQEAIKNDNFDLAYCTLNLSREYKLQELLASDSANNFANFSNSEIDDIISKLRTTEQEEYDKNMHSLLEMYNKQIPYIGLFYEMDMILTNKAVKGEYKSNSYNPYQNIIKFYK